MMYWSVIGDHSHIEESAMDGSLRRVILEKNLRRPTGKCFYQKLYMNAELDVFEFHLSSRRLHQFNLTDGEYRLLTLYPCGTVRVVEVISLLGFGVRKVIMEMAWPGWLRISTDIFQKLFNGVVKWKQYYFFVLFCNCLVQTKCNIFGGTVQVVTKGVPFLEKSTSLRCRLDTWPQG